MKVLRKVIMKFENGIEMSEEAEGELTIPWEEPTTGNELASLCDKADKNLWQLITVLGKEEDFRRK